MKGFKDCIRLHKKDFEDHRERFQHHVRKASRQDKDSNTLLPQILTDFDFEDYHFKFVLSLYKAKSSWKRT